MRRKRPWKKGKKQPEIINFKRKKGKLEICRRNNQP